MLGLGTFAGTRKTRVTPVGVVGKAVEDAIEKHGYRLLDCAQNYLNEDEIGDAVKNVLKRGSVKRSDLFITSKLNNPYHHREHVLPALKKTLLDLDTPYVDLYLMHWPVAFAYVPFDPAVRGFPMSYEPDDCSNVDLATQPWVGGPRATHPKVDMTVSIRETWEAMEALVQTGLVRAIGVANFTVPLLHDLLTYAKIVPAVNQIETHPFGQQAGMNQFCRAQGIVHQAYSPLGYGEFKKNTERTVLTDPTIKGIASRVGRSPAQVVLRWHLQRGVSAIPKTINDKEMKENAALHDFSLTDADMHAIEALDQNYHYLRPRDWFGLPLWDGNLG